MVTKKVPSKKEIFRSRFRRLREIPKKLLTPEELEAYEADLKRYLKAYPFLQEPATLDLLKEALLMKDVQIPRLRNIVFDSKIEIKDLLSSQKQLANLQRTMVLMFTRIGVSYTSQQRGKQEKKILSPIEQQEEESGI
jgi:hypothetical protein